MSLPLAAVAVLAVLLAAQAIALTLSPDRVQELRSHVRPPGEETSSGRVFLAALVVGFGLRLAWVLWVTGTPPHPFADTAQHLAMADQFSHLQSYRLNGVLTAYHAPGYPFLLTPFVLLARALGGPSLELVAALVNTVAGTATIALGATLADRWLGASARNPTAWLLAVAAGPIYLTSLAYNETVHTALLLGALLLLTDARADLDHRPRRLAAIGLLVGYAVLVRTTAAALLVVIVVAIRLAAGSWRQAWRPALATVAVAVAVVVPWVVRNGVQVGVWAPSANSAAYLCQGHRDGTPAAEVDLTDEQFRVCFLGTAYGPNPDEGRWYRDSVGDAVNWAVHHPGEEVRLAAARTGVLYADDSQSLADAVDLRGPPLMAFSTNRHLDRLADGWHRIVLVLALVGLVALPRARAAWPLWATVLALTLVTVVGAPLDRYHHTIMALLAVVAGGTMAAVFRGLRGAIATEGDRPGGRSQDSGAQLS